MSPPPWSTWCTAVKEKPHQLYAELGDVDECPFCTAPNPGRGESPPARGQAGGGQSLANAVVINDEDQPELPDTSTNPIAPVRPQHSAARTKAVVLAGKNRSIVTLNKATNLHYSYAGGFLKPATNKLAQSTQQAKTDRIQYKSSHGTNANIILVEQTEKWLFNRNGDHVDIEFLGNK